MDCRGYQNQIEELQARLNHIKGLLETELNVTRRLSKAQHICVVALLECRDTCKPTSGLVNKAIIQHITNKALKEVGMENAKSSTELFYPKEPETVDATVNNIIEKDIGYKHSTQPDIAKLQVELHQYKTDAHFYFQLSQELKQACERLQSENRKLSERNCHLEFAMSQVK